MRDSDVVPFVQTLVVTVTLPFLRQTSSHPTYNPMTMEYGDLCLLPLDVTTWFNDCDIGLMVSYTLVQ